MIGLRRIFRWQPDADPLIGQPGGGNCFPLDKLPVRASHCLLLFRDGDGGASGQHQRYRHSKSKGKCAPHLAGLSWIATPPAGASRTV